MKLESAGLSELMLQLAARLYGEKRFRRRKLMDATEAEVRRLGFWTEEDDVLASSVGIKSRGLATIDFRFSDLARVGSLVSDSRDSWRMSANDLLRISTKAQASAATSRSEDQPQQISEILSAIRPKAKSLVYDLVTQAGVDTSDWANYRRPESPASNPKYCYNWSFEGSDRVVVCLWFDEMKTDNGVVYQRLNYRDISASPRHFSPNQRKRAADMDHAIQSALIHRLPIRVVVVDGSRRNDSDDESRSHVERRMLDPVPWHVASYADDGQCRLQRGPWSARLETFTSADIAAAGTFAEGAKIEITAQVRERCQRLRDLARSHFANRSPDGRLHCAACNWAAPISLNLSGPIVEIHHGVNISTYPSDGKALAFEEAVKRLTPLCPNCHRVLHAKADGGSFTLEELKLGMGTQDRIASG